MLDADAEEESVQENNNRTVDVGDNTEKLLLLNFWLIVLSRAKPHVKDHIADKVTTQ